MKLRFISCRKAIHDRRSIHGEANSFKPSLIGKGDREAVDESMKLRFISCRKAIHGEANSFKPSLIGKGDHAVVDESTKRSFNSCRRQFMAKPIHDRRSIH